MTGTAFKIDRSQHVPKKSENTQRGRGYVALELPEQFLKWKDKILGSRSFRESVEKAVEERLSAMTTTFYPLRMEMIWLEYGPLFHLGVNCTVGPQLRTDIVDYGSNNVDSQIQADIIHAAMSEYADKLIGALEECESNPDAFKDSKGRPAEYSVYFVVKGTKELSKPPG